MFAGVKLEIITAQYHLKQETGFVFFTYDMEVWEISYCKWYIPTLYGGWWIGASGQTAASAGSVLCSMLLRAPSALIEVHEG